MGKGFRISPVVIIVLLVVLVAIGALIINVLTGGKTSILEKEENSEQSPKIEASLNTKDPDQDSVIISVVASTEDKDGIESITLPNGTTVNGSSKEYTVTENGSYEFVATGVNGKKMSTKVKVSNIKEISADSPYIPEGFEYVGGEVEEGYVISDQSGNQFVWIPVPTGILTRNTMLNSDFEESNSTSSELVNSVAKYYGFYIARFEASSYENGSTKAATSMVGKIPWTNVSYVDAYQASLDMAKAFNYPDGVKTAILNSYAWDTALEWINKTTENYSTSTSFGNYSGTILPTGQTESDIVNNICDLAGNVREWTTEIDKAVEVASNTSKNKNKNTVVAADENAATKRVIRGGSANLSRTAGAHTGYSESISDGYWGFRVILYK